MPGPGERDEQWHDALLNKHGEKVKRMLTRRLNGDHHIADELTQETFTLAWEKRREIHDDAVGWLFVTARNLMLNHLKSVRRHPTDELTDISVPIRYAQAPADANDHLDLYLALSGLTDPEREVLRLKYLEDLSDHQIGEVLKISPDAVRQRLTRARKHARELLAPIQAPDSRGSSDV